MTDIKEQLQFKSSGNSLNTGQDEWASKLKAAAPDPAVGIRHAAVKGTAAYRIHVAAIPRQVGCHYHKIGDEDYAIVAGEGILFFGKVDLTLAEPAVPENGWHALAVSKGNTFVIPEGYAHQLRKTGEADLTILFGCPDDHLDDTVDRFMLPDAPDKMVDL
jgi:mannose-6-phosphate isomerase-like protein (cupin superfamily)